MGDGDHVVSFFFYEGGKVVGVVSSDDFEFVFFEDDVRKAFADIEDDLVEFEKVFCYEYDFEVPSIAVFDEADDVFVVF